MCFLILKLPVTSPFASVNRRIKVGEFFSKVKGLRQPSLTKLIFLEIRHVLRVFQLRAKALWCHLFKCANNFFHLDGNLKWNFFVWSKNTQRNLKFTVQCTAKTLLSDLLTTSYIILTKTFWSPFKSNFTFCLPPPPLPVYIACFSRFTNFGSLRKLPPNCTSSRQPW